MIRKPTFVFLSERCTGCKTCMIACIDKHNLPLGVMWRRVLEYSGGDWLPAGSAGSAWNHHVFAYYISLSCNHCENPVCVKACPTGAMNRDEHGIVSVNTARCVGCRYCEWNCPYGSPQFNKEAGKMSKCDFCRDNLERGLPPACVAACPCRALDYGSWDEMQAKYGLHPSIAPLPNPDFTRPRFICVPSRLSRPLGSNAGMRGTLISNPEEV